MSARAVSQFRGGQGEKLRFRREIGDACCVTRPDAPGSQPRRGRRVSVLALSVHVRPLDTKPWREGRLRDLSIGGALLSSEMPLAIGDRFELRITHPEEGIVAEVKAEVLRVIQRSEGNWFGVRFMELTAEATAGLAGVLSDALHDDLGEARAPQASPTTPTTTSSTTTTTTTTANADGAMTTEKTQGGTPTLTALRLHDVSVYDLFEIDAACTDGELEGLCEDLMATVMRDAAAASGRREARLRVLHASLERLRPLWTDPIKRARYDLRWGYVRAAARLHDAASGAGLDAYTLAALWMDIYPEKVRQANAAVRAARGRSAIVSALKAGLEMDPFCSDKRRRLAGLEGGDVSASVAAGDAPFVRGSLSDVSLASLLHGVAANEADIDVVVRVGNKAVGVVGIHSGILVTAIAGGERADSALRLLFKLPEGTFQARYAPPRDHLRHMQTPALEMLEELAPRS